MNTCGYCEYYSKKTEKCVKDYYKCGDETPVCPDEYIKAIDFETMVKDILKDICEKAKE